MAALHEVIEREGLFCTLYSDRASHFSRPIPRKRGDAANGASAPGTAACRRSCGWPASPRSMGPIDSCANTTLPPSVARVPPLWTQRSGLDVLDPDRTCSGKGRHGRDSRSMVAARQIPLAPHAGRPDGDHSSTSGWPDFDTLRAPRRGLEKRSRGKPGFPPLLGNRLRRFPLSHSRRRLILSPPKSKAKRVA
jgi:hypothetical protein